MEEQNSNLSETELDRAMAARLARLGSMPMDTSRLETALRNQIPAKPVGVRMWLRPMKAIAALVVLTMTVALVLWSLSGGPVMASPSDMARVHADLVAGRIAITQVDSPQEASRVLSEQWAGGPSPEMPAGRAMACCMQSVSGKKMAWVMLRGDQTPITLAVAKASDMRMPDGPQQTRDGIAYHIQATGQLNMVSAQRDGRWICLMGEVSAERLIDIAAKLRFQ